MSQVVTDKIHVEDDDLRELYEKLNLEDSQWDRLMYYEVTGKKIEGDERKYDSSDGSSDSNNSVLSSDNEIESAFEAHSNETGSQGNKPKSATNAAKTKKIDIN